MNTISVQRQGAVIGVRQGTLRVTLHAEEIASFPLELVQELLLHGGVTVTTPALRALLEQRAALHILTRAGRHLGSLQPSLDGHADLLRAQVHAENPPNQLAQARRLLHAKFQNSATVLKRFARRQPSVAVTAAVQEQQSAMKQLPLAASEQLLGLEGQAAAAYFQALGDLISPEWFFAGRNRRPPQDPVNVLLSFGYTLLFQHVLTDLQRVGLHPAFGFLHRPHGRRPTLALDLMEPHRAPLVDRAVLACINRRLLTPADFSEETGTLRLAPAGRQAFLKEIAQRLDAPLAQNLSYRQFMTRGVRRYAEALRAGRIYEPDLLK
ncbi:CRISPR-associated endonuclease Cas1 [Deinococcus marmoris]|uniref:CRISPR-associated endonuclease Cas1 n=1 Tax=Deinococcus marmoris TaxID=249408 RepID=UPI00049579E2|nr:CRISPR-associated endonuclease Cas1 [Deinococcus marmoris]